MIFFLEHTIELHIIIIGVFGRIQILVQSFRIQIHSENVSYDESESLCKTVWVIDHS